MTLETVTLDRRTTLRRREQASFSCNETDWCCHSFNFRCLLTCIRRSPAEEKEIAETFAGILAIEMRTLAIFMIIGIEMACSGPILITC